MGLLHPAAELAHFSCGDFPPCLSPWCGYFLGCDLLCLAFFVISFSCFFQCLGQSPCLFSSHIYFDVPFIGCWAVLRFLWCRFYYRIRVEFCVRYRIFCSVFLCLLGVQAAAGGLSVVLLHSRLFLDTGHTEQITSEGSWSYSWILLTGSFYLLPFMMLQLMW